MKRFITMPFLGIFSCVWLWGEAQVAGRSARLYTATHAAAAADIRRPAALADSAQIFGRAIGTAERPPITAAMLSASGTILARAAVGADGIFHLSADGALSNIVLQLSDRARRLVYRSPAPFDLAAGTVLQIEVAIGTPEIRPGVVPDKPFMPDLLGQNEKVAVLLLERLGLKARVKHVQRDGDADIVIEQDPAAGAALSASTVALLTVRTRPSQPTAPDKPPVAATVPDVTGAPLKDARTALKALNLKSVIERRAHRGAADIVLEQVPRAGAAADALRAVRLIVSTSARAPAMPKPAPAATPAKRATRRATRPA